MTQFLPCYSPLYLPEQAHGEFLSSVGPRNPGNTWGKAGTSPSTTFQSKEQHFKELEAGNWVWGWGNLSFPSLLCLFLPTLAGFWPLAMSPAALTFTLDRAFLIKCSQASRGLWEGSQYRMVMWYYRWFQWHNAGLQQREWLVGQGGPARSIRV